MSDSTVAAGQPAVEPLHYHHNDIDSTPMPQQATPEQLYQYHLFMNTQSPYSPPASPTSFSSKESSSSTAGIIETVVAILGMIMMVIVGVLGYQQMHKGSPRNPRTGRPEDPLPDMTGFIVATACIPLAVCFFTLLMKYAVYRARKQREREGQIALPDDEIDLELQRPGRTGRGLIARFWGAEQDAAPRLDGEDLPPPYEETVPTYDEATQTAQ